MDIQHIRLAVYPGTTVLSVSVAGAYLDWQLTPNNAESVSRQPTAKGKADTSGLPGPHVLNDGGAGRAKSSPPHMGGRCLPLARPMISPSRAAASPVCVAHAAVLGVCHG
eukprot:84038-Chlamydomonas_euryale.AAC.2